MGEAMHHAALREYLKKQPFQPFRITLSNGSQYEIRSPEWMLVTGMTTAIGIPGESGDGELLRLIDNAHINELIPLADNVVAKPA
jgi:hypothetical protein